MLALNLIGRRCIHSTRIFNCKFKFSEVQTEKILSVANTCTVEDLTDRFGLTKPRANRLYSGRQQTSVKCIEELLTIGGFSENVLNQFCRKILNEDNDGDGRIKKLRLRSYITPAIPDDVARKIQSFTSIKCGLTGIAWCTFKMTPNELTNITHWDWRPLPESKFTLHQMASFVTCAVKAIPQSDFYLFESPIAAKLGSSQNADVNVEVSKMVAMASVLVGQRSSPKVVEDLEGKNEESDDEAINNVAYLKKYLYARLFKLYVGTEQISSLNYVERMLRWSNTSAVTSDIVQSLVRVDDDDLKTSYNKSDNDVKEFLSCTLLTGLAFLRLSILKCPNSHASLTGKSK